MDTEKLKVELTKLNMPVDSLVVLQPDPERDSYDLLHVVTDTGMYRYVLTTGELFAHEFAVDSEPCRVLLGGKEYPVIRLWKLMKMLDSVPEKVVMMQDNSVKPLAGVRRDLFKITSNSVEFYSREDNNDDYEDMLNGGLQVAPGVLVAECVLLYGQKM